VGHRDQLVAAGHPGLDEVDEPRARARGQGDVGRRFLGPELVAAGQFAGGLA
jgi:hypothetical protein